MHTKHPYRAVFFDLGGTLFHHLPPHHTEANLLRHFAEQDPARVVQAYGRERSLVEREALASAFFMHRSLVADAFARTQAQFEAVNRDSVRAFCDAQARSVTEALRLRDDTISTLEGLRSRGYYTAIVSNIDDDYIVPLLARTSLTDHFDHWISSERARSCKPHAGIFEQALAQAQLDPSQVLFVGDSVAHDVIGARRIGMGTVLLTADHADKHNEAADHSIERLAELLALLP